MCTTTDKRQIKISPILFMPNLCLIYGSSAKYNDRQYFRLYGMLFDTLSVQVCICLVSLLCFLCSDLDAKREVKAEEVNLSACMCLCL